jgi:hypothetical protein
LADAFAAWQALVAEEARLGNAALLLAALPNFAARIWCAGARPIVGHATPKRCL